MRKRLGSNRSNHLDSQNWLAINNRTNFPIGPRTTSLSFGLMLPPLSYLLSGIAAGHGSLVHACLCTMAWIVSNRPRAVTRLHKFQGESPAYALVSVAKVLVGKQGKIQQSRQGIVDSHHGELNRAAQRPPIFPRT